MSIRNRLLPAFLAMTFCTAGCSQSKEVKPAGGNAGSESADAICEQAVTILKNEGADGIVPALHLFDEAIRLDSSSPKAYLGAAKICLIRYETGEDRDESWLEKGLGYVDALLKQQPDNIEGRIKKAQILLDRKEYRQASYNLQKAIKAEPKHVEANLIYLGYLVRQVGLKEASAFAAESCRNFEKDPVVLRAYGTLFLDNKAWDEAQQYYAKAVGAGFQNDPGTLIGLARSFRGQGRFKDAVHVYGNAYKADSEDKAILLESSACLMQARDYEFAAYQLGKYVESNPSEIPALIGLETCYRKLGKTKEADAVRARINKARKGKTGK